MGNERSPEIHRVPVRQAPFLGFHPLDLGECRVEGTVLHAGSPGGGVNGLLVRIAYDPFIKLTSISRSE